MLEARPITCLAAEVTRCGSGGGGTSAVSVASTGAASPLYNLLFSEALVLAAVLKRRNTCTRAPSMISGGNDRSTYSRRKGPAHDSCHYIKT